MGVSALSPALILGLCIGQFVGGMLKASLGRYGLYLFGSMEVTLCTTISVSAGIEVSTLSYGLSKLIFSLAISVGFIALFFDVFFASQIIIKIERERNRSESPVASRFAIMRPDMRNCFYFTPVFLAFSAPTAVVSIVAVVRKTQFNLLNNENPAFSVTDVLQNGQRTAAFCLCLSGLVILLVAITGVAVAGHMLENLDYDIPDGMVVLFVLLILVGVPSIFVGLALLPAAALHSSDSAAAAYFFITITTTPPVLSFFVTFSNHVSS